MRSHAREYLDRAFHLACFIHGDRARALCILTEAYAGLDVAAVRQDKRLYYLPAGRRKADGVGPSAFRTKVCLEEPHLLQRLIYLQSEIWERRQEQSPEGPPLTEADMVVRFIKHLVQITTGRNSFYVALGVGRLLHDYTTAQAMALYGLVVQDPDRVPDDYYYRARKKRLMEELRERFGAVLETVCGAYGEERFRTPADPGGWAALASECLRQFTPWDTPCLPSGIDPTRDALPSLAFDGTDPDREHPIEANRMHVLLDPHCLARWAAAHAVERAVKRLLAAR